MLSVESPENGHEKVILEPRDSGPVPQKWWSMLDEAGVCRYCVRLFECCVCEEQGRVE